MSRPHVRGAFPWLRSGPLWRMRSDTEPALAAYLDREGFRRLDLDGRLLTSRAAAHAELGRLLAFPDWYGAGWDAFHDCFFGFVSEHADERVAVVWSHLDAAAPATGVEVGWALLTAAFEHRWSEQGRPTLWLEVFALGDGPDFDGP
ncbi:barstar family protein [Nocardioides anomalus]|uniref:Barstar family protein n=1 Tax=Nocardioides anomalus TaxID=2712223 RepID=A0A6G6WB14_9ACTN|nr:barstar family protein [Nocardioides anomalus]QIG42295.1 barstar family protein [Nocardioides anomalus]